MLGERQTFAKITLLNPNNIIRVKQIVHTHKDIQEFNKQIKQLLDKGEKQQESSH